MSLTQVLIASGLLEKLVMKYASSFPSSASLGNVGAITNSPSNAMMNAVVSPSSPTSGDTYDAEVQKLFALCLDLADDETSISSLPPPPSLSSPSPSPFVYLSLHRYSTGD